MSDAIPSAPLGLTPRSAFHGFLHPVASPRSGVTVAELDDLQIATVIARNGDFAPTVKALYGIDLTAAPRCFEGGSLAFMGTGPRTWLALREGGAPLAEELSRDLGACAAVSDQSDGYAVLRISGPKARATFEKGLSVDLHPKAFGPGDVAVTTCAHIGVVIRQVDDAPTYDIAMFRSFAGSFCHWLTESAAEYGLAAGGKGRG